MILLYFITFSSFIYNMNYKLAILLYFIAFSSFIYNMNYKLAMHARYKDISDMSLMIFFTSYRQGMGPFAHKRHA